MHVIDTLALNSISGGISKSDTMLTYTLGRASFAVYQWTSMAVSHYCGNVAAYNVGFIGYQSIKPIILIANSIVSAVLEVAIFAGVAYGADAAYNYMYGEQLFS